MSCIWDGEKFDELGLVSGCEYGYFIMILLVM